MTLTEMPLAADNQSFRITLAGALYQISVLWRGSVWVMDLSDSSGGLIVGGIPLVSGADLLAQHAYLGLGFSLYVLCDNPLQVYPTQYDLGTYSHLYIGTE